MSDIEKRPNTGSFSNPVELIVAVKNLQNMANKLDPALRRVSFIGWPRNISGDKRVELMSGFMTKKIQKCARC